MMTLFASHAVQSFPAFLSSLLLFLYFPIVIAILGLIALALPVGALYLCLGKKGTTVNPFRGVCAAILFPVGCVVGSLLFYPILPYAGGLFGWLRVRDMVKATNGPPALVFKYLASSKVYVPTILPWYFEKTPQSDLDELRCHVVTVYLTEAKAGTFVRYQYPELYKTLSEEAEKKKQ